MLPFGLRGRTERNGQVRHREHIWYLLATSRIRIYRLERLRWVYEDGELDVPLSPRICTIRVTLWDDCGCRAFPNRRKYERSWGRHTSRGIPLRDLVACVYRQVPRAPEYTLSVELNDFRGVFSSCFFYYFLSIN